MNLLGPAMGLITLLIIGLGFVWVIRGEYHLGYLWWPYIMGAGVLAVLMAALIPGVWLPAILGAAGASIIWGATELKEQAVRTEVGWYPFNHRRRPTPPGVERIRKWRAPHL